MAARSDMPAAEDTTDWLHSLHQRAAHMAQSHPGVLVEDKGASMALHWRAVPMAEAAMTEAATRALADLGDGWIIQPGKFVAEIRPRGADKGTALRALATELDAAGKDQWAAQEFEHVRTAPPPAPRLSRVPRPARPGRP